MTRTRLAISPQKRMDIEDLRNALYTYLIAKHDNGEFILRIEDANQNLYNLEAEESIYATLNAFDLIYDEGPKKEYDNISYIQSERLSIYKSYAEKLIKRGKAYYCFCTKEELNRKRLEAEENKTSYLYDGTCRNFPRDEARRKILIEEKYVIREAMPKEGQTTFCDLVYGDITTLNSNLEDQILIKSDGTPTYNFSHVLDDALMNITHVTSSSKFLTSTPKYFLLYEALGFPVPKFVHYPEIITKTSNMLSDLLEQGFLKEAILNYVALLGWSPKSSNEFFSLEELVREFKIENIKKRPAHFDIKKLEWMNRHYMKNLSEEEYVYFTRPYLEKFYNIQGKNEEWIMHLLKVCKNRLNFASEIGLIAHMFFVSDFELEEEYIQYLKSDKFIENALKIFKSEVEKVNNWNLESIQILLDQVQEKCGKEKDIYMLIRVATTGSKCGPNLVDCLYLLGKDTVLKRLDV